MGKVLVVPCRIIVLHSESTADCSSNSRLSVVVERVDVDVPQAQLMQLPNHFLHGVEVLVLHPIQGAGPRVGVRHLGVGEVQQTGSAARAIDLIEVGRVQRAVPA